MAAFRLGRQKTFRLAQPTAAGQKELQDWSSPAKPEAVTNKTDDIVGTPRPNAFPKKRFGGKNV